MKLLKNRYLKLAGIILVLFGLVLIVLQWRAKHVVENFLKRKIPSHLVLKYDQLEVNALSRKYKF